MTDQSREEKAKRYAAWKRKLWLADLLVSLGFFGGVLSTGKSAQLATWANSRFPSIFLQVAVFSGALSAVLALMTFPLDWFGGFYIERRFGLSSQGAAQWFVDYAKRLLVGGLLGLVMVEALYFFIRATPAHWWIWAALFWLAWSVLLAQLFPILLIPIFYRQKPLGDKGLEKRLSSFLARCGTKVSGLFEINLSRTTKKANACLTGLGKTRRVLLGDTLLSTYPPEEVEVVLAHEVGHHRYRHIGILIGASAVLTGLGFFLIDRLIARWLAALGIGGIVELAALPAVGAGLFLFNLVLMPVVHGISRRLEAQADRFALQATKNPSAFIQVMRRLADQNLAEVSPPRWVEWLFYDHPSIGKRIAMAEGFAR